MRAYTANKSFIVFASRYRPSKSFPSEIGCWTSPPTARAFWGRFAFENIVSLDVLEFPELGSEIAGWLSDLLIAKDVSSDCHPVNSREELHLTGALLAGTRGRLWACGELKKKLTSQRLLSLAFQTHCPYRVVIPLPPIAWDGRKHWIPRCWQLLQILEGVLSMSHLIYI